MNFIYITTNLVNRKQYIGSHNGEKDDGYLGSGRPVFLNAIKKYGKENFRREILEECDPSMNLLLETKYIKEYNTLVPNGYNISPTGGHGLRGKVSEETKEKIKRKQKGKKKILYFIEKYGENEGKKKYDIWVEKIKFPMGNVPWIKGKNHSKESNEKNRQSHLGKINSKETRRKISESNKGKISPIKGKTYEEIYGEELGEKRRKQQGLIRQNKPHTEVTKHKMSAASKGKKKNYDVWNKGKTELNITPKLINDVKELKESGLTQKEIADKKNYSISTIARMLNGFYNNIEQITRGK
jgi:group I intron endonuclease